MEESKETHMCVSFRLLPHLDPFQFFCVPPTLTVCLSPVQNTSHNNWCEEELRKSASVLLNSFTTFLWLFHSR